MKKLFGGKPKQKPNVPPLQEEHPISTLIHQQHALYDAERWEVVPPNSSSHNSSYVSLPPGVSPSVPSPTGPRSPSPFSINSREQQPQPQHRKKPQAPAAPVALRILGALDPAGVPQKQQQDDRFGIHSFSSDGGHREREKDPPPPPERTQKRGFWSRGDKDKDKDREREKERERERDRERERERKANSDSRDHARDKGRSDNDGDELTRMIGYLTATASEDWSLVLEVNDRVSGSDANSKEAARAIRREFKYGEPTAQLAAARLWAILLRNVKTDYFVHQCTTRKFTDTLEDLLTSSRTSPVVRERVLDVISAAAFASGRTSSFKPLWKRVKPHDKPDEGEPILDDDAMFIPPLSARQSYENNYNHNIPQYVVQPDPPPTATDYPSTPTPTANNHPRKHKESRNRIIPPDEDIRRLFQECKIGQGNASLLSQALILTKPEDLKTKDVIREFYLKCRSSQELIYAQIPWASAEAEKSRNARDREARENGYPEEQRREETTQEKLLGSLLSANVELMDALQQYDDLERVAMERRAEDISRKEVKMDRRQLQQYQVDGDYLSDPSHVAGGAGGLGLGSSPPTRSRSRSPSPIPQAHNTPYHSSHVHSHSHSETTGLAPPPPAPHGPRLPGQQQQQQQQLAANSVYANSYHSNRSRSPSPVLVDGYGVDGLQSGIAGMRMRGPGDIPGVVRSSVYDDYEDEEVLVKPSAKALGKQRVVEEDMSEHYAEEDFYEGRDEVYFMEDKVDSDDERSSHDVPQQQYVYDAVAERTQQRIREGHNMLVNGVH
ncbi:hypothetical protein H0H92_015413 [Tricholoma furcatifolium]|nr:hypothetical protein H0H92_015413 [Tricholoma furcatifolium]